MSLSPVSSPRIDPVSRRAGPRTVTVIRPASLTRFNFAANLSNLFKYRDLLYTLSAHRIKVRYKQTLLGIAWAILQPLSIMLLFTVIFSVIVKIPSPEAPYAVFLYAALLPWTFFSAGLSTGAGSLLSNSQLIRKVYFPREILPLTYVFAALFDFLVASSVLIGLLVYYKVPVTLTTLYTLPIVLLLTVFLSAMTLFFSAIQIRFRDIGIAMPLLLQVWMFATPVIYPLGAVPERLRAAYMLNPTAGIIESFRRVVLFGETPDFSSLGLSAVISVASLIAAYIYFKRVEATMADII